MYIPQSKGLVLFRVPHFYRHWQKLLQEEKHTLWEVPQIWKICKDNMIVAFLVTQTYTIFSLKLCLLLLQILCTFSQLYDAKLSGISQPTPWPFLLCCGLPWLPVHRKEWKNKPVWFPLPVATSPLKTGLAASSSVPRCRLHFRVAR